MRRVTYLRLPLLLLLAACLLPLLLGMSAPGDGPYDPRPLMKQVEAGCGPYTFAVFGDSYAAADLTPLLEMVAAHKPTFAVTTGDMVLDGRKSASWSLLRTRGGSFLRMIPTWPTIGNHELGGHGAGADAFEQFYRVPARNYSFTFRRDKFMVLDHNGVAPREQVEYVTRELADRDQYQHVFVFRHSPFYTVGSKNRREVPNRPTALTELFTKHHVTAVFSGHDHGYYRTRRDGVDYFVAASAGAGMYALTRLRERLPTDAYAGLSNEEMGYVRHSPGRPDVHVPLSTGRTSNWVFAVFVRVDGTKVTAKTIGADGAIWDQFTL